MSNYTSFADLKADALGRAGQATDGTSDLDAFAGTQVVRAAKEIENHADYLFLRVNPPYAFNSVAPITAGTVQVTNGLLTIVFSLPSAGVSLTGREIKIAGWNEAYRIAVHGLGAAQATLDTAFNGPTTPAAGYTVFQREYDLVPAAPAPALRHIVEMVIAEQSVVVEQKDEKWLREKYPDPPQGVWPPRYFARIGESRIRFDGYPTLGRRVEVAYTQVTADIDGTNVAILIPANWRYVIADGALGWVLSRLDDTRAKDAMAVFALGKEEIVADDHRKRAMLGVSRPGKGPY